VRQLIALATSAVTIYGMWLAGSKRWQAWLVGLCNQGLWLVFIVAFGAWGLLPLNAALIGVYSRNLVLWRRSPSIGTCRLCGCTDDNACFGGCYWVEPDLCSECVGDGEGALT
jgi:hypothetical protein